MRNTLLGINSTSDPAEESISKHEDTATKTIQSETLGIVGNFQQLNGGGIKVQRRGKSVERTYLKRSVGKLEEIMGEL